MIQIELNLLSHYSYGPLHKIADLDRGIDLVNRRISKKIYATVYDKAYKNIYIQVYDQLERDLKKVKPA